MIQSPRSKILHSSPIERNEGLLGGTGNTLSLGFVFFLLGVVLGPGFLPIACLFAVYVATTRLVRDGKTDEEYFSAVTKTSIWPLAIGIVIHFFTLGILQLLLLGDAIRSVPSWAQSLVQLYSAIPVSKFIIGQLVLMCLAIGAYSWSRVAPDKRNDKESFFVELTAVLKKLLGTSYAYWEYLYKTRLQTLLSLAAKRLEKGLADMENGFVNPQDAMAPARQLPQATVSRMYAILSQLPESSSSSILYFANTAECNDSFMEVSARGTELEAITIGFTHPPTEGADWRAFSVEIANMQTHPFIKEICEYSVSGIETRLGTDDYAELVSELNTVLNQPIAENNIRPPQQAPKTMY
ncbi:MAG: hypothetical protein QG629_209 [Patescibacteria group bacterium]|nr:hypothetical protein [Candidatus Saccharibacteria bacterium]MDQ5963127.1 hypothetical protein [Patescibacteria group bacterium]